MLSRSNRIDFRLAISSRSDVEIMSRYPIITYFFYQTTEQETSLSKRFLSLHLRYALAR